jgi:hypothetical protein
MSNVPSAIELITTEALLDELKVRFPVVVFAGAQEWAEGQGAHFIAAQGDWLSVLGLVQMLDHDLKTRWEEDAVDAHES